MEANVLRQPDLHDGPIFGVTVLPAKALHLDCKSASGGHYSVRATELVRLRMDNFLEGNIIFEIATFPAAHCPVSIVERLFPTTPLGIEPLAQVEPQQAIAGRWTYLQVTTSYGCDLVALFKGRLEVETIEVQ